MKRVTQDIRIDEDIDLYIRTQANDPFRNRPTYGAYSNIVNAALRNWMQEHKKLIEMSTTQGGTP